MKSGLRSASPEASPSATHSRVHTSESFGEPLIVVGASTGGPEAVKVLLSQMPQNCPGILVTQHMPAAHTASFAARLNSICAITVKEAEHGERIRAGHAYIAPGHSHLLLTRALPHYVIGLEAGPPVSRHCPSVDALFRSVARLAGANAIGVLLTGMGKDGADGLLQLRKAGAHTFAQDQASCVVFGMPREAIALGGACEVLPVDQIASRVARYLATASSWSPRAQGPSN